MENQEEYFLDIVICDHNRDGHVLKRAFVVPGHITLERGDKVTWRAGDTDLVMFFPDKRLFDAEKIVVKAGTSKTETVREEADRGTYPYAVYTEKINDFAEGGSMPRMIIK